jgi:hypothetical protein
MFPYPRQLIEEGVPGIQGLAQDDVAQLVLWQNVNSNRG